jgi:hypothetical protein
MKQTTLKTKSQNENGLPSEYKLIEGYEWFIGKGLN